MKFIIALLSTVILTTHAQTKHLQSDFFLNNTQLYWQHVFEAPNASKEEINTLSNQLFSESRLHSDLTTAENYLAFTIDQEALNYKKYGGKEMTVPMILRGEMSYRAIIEIQDYKYRVTVKEVYFRNQTQPILDGSLQLVAVKKDRFRTNNQVLEILDFCQKHFIDKFTLKTQEDPKW